jgi:hypothetical protein
LGCASGPGRAPAAQAASAQAFAPSSADKAADARAVAALLPADADRCFVAVPARLSAKDLAVGPLLSQLEGLPWSLALPVSAYGRAEHQPTTDRRSVREYVRFASRDRARIRKELDRVLEPRISWDEQSATCAGETTCVRVRAEFLDDRTVALSTGDWPYATETSTQHCVRLLEHQPNALEVSARRTEFVGAVGDHRGTEQYVLVEKRGFKRVVRRVFADEGAAEASLEKWLSGAQDVPLLAGVVVEAVLSRDGLAVEQHTRGAIEDLWLALEDHERLRRALAGTDDATVDSGAIDVRDLELVRNYVEQVFELLAQAPAEERKAPLAAMDELLSRVHREHPADEGMWRKHFALRLELRGDACGAASLAEARLGAGVVDEGRWRLSERRALAACDEGRLRTALEKAYGLSPSDATRMASELVEQVRRGRAYERAEWGYRLALELAERGKKQRVLPSAARVPLVALPRLLAYLARLSPEHAAHDFGVHILASLDADAQPSTVESPIWHEDTRATGELAAVFAAATWDDAQLEAQGRALAERLGDGPVELVFGIDVIGGDKRGSVQRIAGVIAHGELTIERASPGLARARWELVHRYLTRPLESMVGSRFPPDELVLSLRSADELARALEALHKDADFGCDQESLTLRCRGPLDDARAAARGLVRVARLALELEAQAFWDGPEP